MAHLLIIDDDPQVLKLIASYLTRDGHDVTTATNGKEGIKLLTAGQFDIIITDIVMPEKDGLEVLMWLRGQQSRPKVIAISGGSTGTPQDLLLTLASFSADKVLPKPVDRKTLRNVVEELLQG